ncbi:MAG: hypothetical protein VKQ33_16150 [Candidatus Sericytochromatia bacterium]|nr:hypothetical protein [Candidatus Sericytochromatia bacterium]
MRRLLTSTLIAALGAGAAGCAASAPSGAALKASSLERKAPAAAATHVVAATSAAAPLTSTAPDAAPLAGEAPAPGSAVLDRPQPPADEAAIPEAPAFDLGGQPRRITASGEAGAQSLLDPWRPYGVGVVSKTATSVTLAWRTDLAARAIVYHGKTFGLSRRGYDGVYHVNRKAKTQQVTLSGLSRFRSYTFVVVGLGELTMQFPSYPVQVRTRLF